MFHYGCALNCVAREIDILIGVSLATQRHATQRAAVMEMRLYSVIEQRSAYNGICVTNYVDQQALKLDDDYILPHKRLWTFNVLVCPLSVTERFLSQPLVCGTVFHRTSLLLPLSLHLLLSS